MVFWPNLSLRSRGKGPVEAFFIWPKNKRARAEFISFSALGEGAYFHSTPSPMPLIFFITRLLLMHLFSFRAFRENFNEYDEKGGHMPRLLLRELYKNFSVFSYEAYFHSAPSPTALIFNTRLLRQHLFSFCIFSNSAYIKRSRGKKWHLIKIPVIDKDLYFKKLKQNHI
jgi:hypothetical protein